MTVVNISSNETIELSTASVNTSEWRNMRPNPDNFMGMADRTADSYCVYELTSEEIEERKIFEVTTCTLAELIDKITCADRGTGTSLVHYCVNDSEPTTEITIEVQHDYMGTCERSREIWNAIRSENFTIDGASDHPLIAELDLH